MSNFTIEISVENDKKVISLDADEMDIYVYQKTGDGMVRAFEITCDAPGGKVIGTLLTKAEFVGADDDPDAPIELKTVETYLGTSVIEAYSNKYGD